LIITKMEINVEWHNKNKMPKNPSLEQRAKWHKEHAKHCQCRPLTEKLIKELKLR